MDKIEKVLGPHARHPGARRRHERPGDGLADGRVRQAPRPYARVRDRQADRARGLIRARGRDRPRRRPCVPARRLRDRTSTRPTTTLRRQGFGNVGVLGGAADAGARRDDGRRLRRAAARSPPRTASTPRSLPSTCARAATRGGLRREPETIDPDELVAVECDVFIPAALGGMIHKGNAERHALPHDRRGREQPDHPRGGRDPQRQGRHDRARRAGQRGRRGRVLLRVGAEPPALPLERGAR